jgi:hypothetical protein
MAKAAEAVAGQAVVMPPPPATPDHPSNSAALSMLELRRHLLRKAGALTVRARLVRQRGGDRKAARLAQESDLLLLMAKQMGDKIR